MPPVAASAQAKRQLSRDETVDNHVEPVTFERETIAPNITYGTRLVEGNEATGLPSLGEGTSIDAQPASQ